MHGYYRDFLKGSLGTSICMGSIETSICMGSIGISIRDL